MKRNPLITSILLACMSATGSMSAQTVDDSFTFAESVSLYSGYFYNPKAGYVDASGNVQKGRQIAEHVSLPGKFRYTSGGSYNALTCSGFVIPVMCRYLYGRAQWQQKLRENWQGYQQAGSQIATRFALPLSANLTAAQIRSTASIQSLVTLGTLNTASYYFFTVSHGNGGHVGFVKVNSDGSLVTYQYSDMRVRDLPANMRRDPSDETYDISKYKVVDGTLLKASTDEPVLPVPVRGGTGMLPLIMAQRTTRGGYYEGSFLSWYQTSSYGAYDCPVQLYEMRPPLNARIIYSWSSQARDLDIGVYFLGTSMGWSHPNSSAYMSWTGDDTSYAGSETVTINLQKALDDGRVNTATPVNIILAAGWYSPAGGSGPANVRAQLLRQDTVLYERQKIFTPGRQNNAASFQIGSMTVDLGSRTMRLD